MTKPKIDGTRQKLGAYTFFKRHFKPIVHPKLANSFNAGDYFTDYVYDYVMDMPQRVKANQIWSITDDEHGGLFIQAGYRRANTIGWLATEEPWVSELDQYTTG